MLRRAVWILTLLSLAVGPVPSALDRSSPRQPLQVRLLLTDYESGNHPAVSVALDSIRDLQRTLPAFERDADRWVKEAADPPARWRRQLTAASLALEIAHRLRDVPAEPGAAYLVWASLLMRQSPPQAPSDAERLWYLACIAGMLEQRNPWVLVAGMPTGSSTLLPLVQKVGSGGQLAVALARFPDEHRFRLLRVASREWRLRVHRFMPSYLQEARLRVEGRISDEPGSTALTDAREVLQEFTRISEIARAYEPLAGVASLRAEVELRLGWLDSAAMNWSSALERFSRVRGLTDEVDLEYLSHLFSGQVLQRVGNRAAALAEFNHAVALIPGARAAATHLATELLLSERADDRDRAYTVLQNAYSPVAPDDPWRLYFHADARLWPVYMARLRQALR